MSAILLPREPEEYALESKATLPAKHELFARHSLILEV